MYVYCDVRVSNFPSDFNARVVYRGDFDGRHFVPAYYNAIVANVRNSYCVAESLLSRAFRPARHIARRVSFRVSR